MPKKRNKTKRKTVSKRQNKIRRKTGPQRQKKIGRKAGLKTRPQKPLPCNVFNNISLVAYLTMPL
ncbi:MAG: hypothetical protein CVV39_03720 [Planctomycetes bacterium HGW-Planctomycetes-1]|nr:MAG: hypothetical protein CVV39_03720 [Planctomycetes bacterium HGW-Planctomycetes-1]